jgi:hypothetical protein
VVALLFFGPTATSAYRVAHPAEYDEFEPALAHLRANWQEGDGVYVYARSRTAFLFYARKYGFGEEQVVVYPGGVWNEFLEGLAPYRGLAGVSTPSLPRG